jgi:hypothetical protein
MEFEIHRASPNTIFMREKQSDVSLKACADRQNIGAGHGAAFAATAA